MKTAGTFEISHAWWVKERPDEIAKDGETRKFDALLKDLESALTKAKGGTDEDGAVALRKLADQLHEQAKKVTKIVDGLAKGAKTDLKKNLDNTSDALAKPLIAATKSAIGAIKVADDDDDNPGQFGSKEAHAKYLTKRLKKLKTAQMYFAVTLPSNDPADMRLSLHISAKGPALATKLKSACKGKQTTFGRAGTDALVQALGSDVDAASGTLILYLEGNPISNLAKRMRDMFKQLGVKVFTKVKVIKDGNELDSADADAASEPLTDADLTGDDTVVDPEKARVAESETKEGETEETETTETTSGLTKADLTVRLKEIGAMFVTQPEALRKSVMPLLREAGEIIKAATDGDATLPRAERIIEALETRLDTAATSGEASAGRAAEAKAETPVNAVQFGKASILWGRARGQLRAQIQRLASEIVAACGDDPEYAEWKRDAPSLVDHADMLDGELEQVLDALDLARTLPERQQLLNRATALIAEYSEDLRDEFFVLTEGDTELPTVQASATLAALDAISKVVAQGQRMSA